jgi:hypothetical protein
MVGEGKEMTAIMHTLVNVHARNEMHRKLADYSGATYRNSTGFQNPQFQNNTIGVGILSMKQDRNP